MTTTELIEKYGIGHNRLSDAYALGMMHGLDDKEHAVEFAEEKARADAIEECKKIVKEKCTRNCMFSDCIECMCRQFDELKEKKNE